MKLDQACKKLGTILFLLTPFLASAQQVQRNPTVVHETAHTTTPLAFRDMKPEQWHNTTKVMVEHDRNPVRHISNMPDPLVRETTTAVPPVGTTSLLNFDGINDAQGGGFVPPDTNASVGSTQVVETVNVAYAVYDKTTGVSPRVILALPSPLPLTQLEPTICTVSPLAETCLTIPKLESGRMLTTSQLIRFRMAGRLLARRLAPWIALTCSPATRRPCNASRERELISACYLLTWTALRLRLPERRTTSWNSLVRPS